MEKQRGSSSSRSAFSMDLRGLSAVTWLGWKPYREEVERLDAEDAAAGHPA
jgi:hypothetical protein